MKHDKCRIFHPEEFRDRGHKLVDRLADFLADSATGSADQVLSYEQPDQLYDQWKSLIGTNPSWLDVVEEVLGQCIRLHHPKYLGHQISPPAPVAALSGLLSDLVNNGMGVYEMGMAGTVLERIVIEFAAKQMGYGDDSGGVMTSGGSLANLTALLAARSIKSSSDVWQHGMRDSHLALMVSQQAHYCVGRAARIMGWGDAGVIQIPCDNQFRMKTELLDESYASASNSGRQVIAVVGSACTTATGSFDDLRSIGEFCKAKDLWFHVDGAHGVAAAFSQKYRWLVDGIELADSVTLDFHKMLLVPALASALVFRNASDSYRTFAQHAEYLFEDPDRPEWFNLARRTLECTKFMMGFKVFSVLAHHGPAAWDENVTRLHDLAHYFARQIIESDSFELLTQPQSNIVCFRYINCPVDRVNDHNASIREYLLTEGRFYIVQTTIDGQLWLRVTIGSAHTGEHDLEALLKEIDAKFHSLACRRFDRH